MTPIESARSEVSGDVAAGAPREDRGQLPRGRRDHRAPADAPAAAAGVPVSGTRERILDVALDLFVEQGFDKTSLREIAERLGVTKAALYYHFQGKDDILMALHMGMHDLMRTSVAQLAGEAPSRTAWLAFLDGIVDQIASSSRLFLLHQRNAAAFAGLHHLDQIASSHGGAEVEPDQVFRDMLSDPRLSLDDRVRIGGALALVLSGATLAVETGSAPHDPAELARVLRVAVRDLLRAGDRHEAS